MQSDQEKLLSTLTSEVSLPELQAYLKTCLTLRGFDNQRLQEKMLLLVEEVGELAKAIRKEHHTGPIDSERSQHYDSVESEIADVFIVLVSICNLLDIDMYDAFHAKEAVNVKRSWT